jgi:formylglycine-generating enzyme required for sulfatase activity
MKLAINAHSIHIILLGSLLGVAMVGVCEFAWLTMRNSEANQSVEPEPNVQQVGKSDSEGNAQRDEDAISQKIPRNGFSFQGISFPKFVDGLVGSEFVIDMKTLTVNGKNSSREIIERLSEWPSGSLDSIVKYPPQLDVISKGFRKACVESGTYTVSYKRGGDENIIYYLEILHDKVIAADICYPRGFVDDKELTSKVIAKMTLENGKPSAVIETMGSLAVRWCISSDGSTDNESGEYWEETFNGYQYSVLAQPNIVDLCTERDSGFSYALDFKTDTISTLCNGVIGLDKQSVLEVMRPYRVRKMESRETVVALARKYPSVQFTEAESANYSVEYRISIRPVGVTRKRIYDEVNRVLKINMTKAVSEFLKHKESTTALNVDTRAGQHLAAEADQHPQHARAAEARRQAALIPAWASAVGKDGNGSWAKLVVGGQTQVLRLIPAGTFQMGSEANDDEKPVHQVTISEPFWLGDSEVTQGLWQAVMGNNPSKFTGDANRPVEQVSWDACQSFIQKFNGQVQGLRAGLPTEAQWEYACRAGTAGDYAGDLNAMAWYDANAGGTSHPVKGKLANAFGLYDMHGNVWEWCADWYADSYAAGSQHDPSGPSSGSLRVIRGGSWNLNAGYCRSAHRGGITPGGRATGIGFRVAAQATP